jgi:hypothetical protein
MAARRDTRPVAVFAGLRQVHLVQSDEFRLLDDACVVQRQLAMYGLVISHRVFGRRIEDVHNHACALDVTKELMTEAYTLVRTFD